MMGERWINWTASVSIILLIGVLLIQSFNIPECGAGYVPQLNIPAVGWVCIQGYKP